MIAPPLSAKPENSGNLPHITLSSEWEGDNGESDNRMIAFIARLRARASSGRRYDPPIDHLISCGNALLIIRSQASNRFLVSGCEGAITLRDAQLIRSAGMLRAHGLTGYHTAHIARMTEIAQE